jgi:hypothetical protein
MRINRLISQIFSTHIFTPTIIFVALPQHNSNFIIFTYATCRCAAEENLLSLSFPVQQSSVSSSTAFHENYEDK